MKRSLICILALGLAATVSAKNPVKIPGSSLSLRVLTRTNSNVYEKPDESSTVVKENVPTFTTYYVYEKPSSTDFDDVGWYEVGVKGSVDGWMKASDVMEWHQALCLTFTHPDGRDPVLFFKKKDGLESVIGKGKGARASAIDGYYATIADKKADKSFPIISKEPVMDVDWKNNFYLLPILQFIKGDVDNDEALLLQVASASPDSRGKDDITDDDVADRMTDTGQQGLKKLKMNVVFAIDTTGSMGGIIGGVLSEITRFAGEIADKPDLNKNFKLGVWGYRDQADEYVAKNFTPTLETAADFKRTMSRVKHDGGGDFSEAMFNAAEKAINDTAWEQGALKVLVMIGDAPSHEASSPQNIGGQSAATIRQMASDKDVTVISMFMDQAPGSDPSALAEAQFMALAENEGSEGDAAYFSCEHTDLTSFKTAFEVVIAVGEKVLSTARSGADLKDVESTSVSDLLDDEPSRVSSDLEDIAEAVTMSFKAGITEYIGTAGDAEAPRDIIGWVLEKDLRDPFVPAFDVRVLTTKNQLESLRKLLDELVQAATKTKEIDNMTFFKSLVSVATLGSIDPDQVANATALAKTGLIPKFIEGLPYKSKVMGLNDEIWASFSADEIDSFINDLENKLNYYNNIYADTENWIPLNEGDDPGDHIYPVSLEMLPLIARQKIFFENIE